MIRVPLILFLGYFFIGVSGQNSMREWCSTNSSFREPSSASCKGYWECNHGNVTYKTCPVFKSFDSVKSECVWNIWSNSNVTCGRGGRDIDESWCSIGSVYKMPVNGQCNWYYECNNGKLSFGKCTWPLNFNPIDRVCQVNIWPMEFECSKYAATQPTTTVKPRCPFGSKFVRPYPSDCTKYYNCEYGVESIEECGSWKKFDSITFECRYDYWGSGITCASMNETTRLMPQTTMQPTTMVASSSLSTIKPLSNDKFTCLRGDYFTKVDPTDCRKYYVCSNGTITKESCSDFSRFNPLTHVCVLEFIYTTVNCSAVPDKPICKLGYKFRTGYPGDCSKYFTCDKGKVTVESCATLQKFDSNINECRYDTPWSDIKCAPYDPAMKPLPTMQPTTTPTARVEQTTSRSQPKIPCSKENYYTKADPDDCQKYYLCSNGTVTHEKCFWFKKYNPLTDECQFNLIFNRVNCSAKPAKPVCKVGYNYKAPYPGNSAKYWDCSNGRLREENCGYLYSYDDSTQSCNFNVFRYNLQHKKLDKEVRNCRTGVHYNTSYEGDCRKYYECKEGRVTEKECKFAEKYDNKLSKCTPMSQCDLLTCTSKGPLCYPGLHYKTSIQGNCADYSECKDGEWSTKSCPLLHHFDPTTLECKLIYINEIQCNARPKCSRESLADITERKTKFVTQRILDFDGELKCLKGNYFTMVDSTDCQKYYTCSNGIVKEEECSWLKKFNPSTHECQYSFIFNSVDRSVKPVKPVCKVGYNYKTSFPGNSVKYWNCSNGTLSQQYCGYLTYYDEPTQSCKFKIIL